LNKNRNKLSAGRPSERNKAMTFAQLSDDAPDMKRVNFQISAELHAKLKVYSAKTGKSVKELLTDYIVTLPD
jgi:hypothetical protein